MSHRVVVVGAGPAGIRAAQCLRKASLQVTVIDEGRKAGGQIYRQQPDNFSRSYTALYGGEAHRAQRVHDAFAAIEPAVDYRPATAVWNGAAGQLHTHGPDGLKTVPFESLVLCTGATDRIMPVKGWTAAGVFSLGGAQIALKSQACSIGREVVFLGTGPLLYLTAAQYVKAGANVVAVLDTASQWRRLAALPALMAQPAVAGTGISLTAALLRAGIRMYTGIRPLEIVGDERGVTAVRFTDKRGDARTIDCDALALGYHLRPETQLADLLDCRFRYDRDGRHWLPETDVDGRSSVPGIYLAGDGVSLLGARAAEHSGMLAALALLSDLGCAVDGARMAQLRRRLARSRRFADGIRHAFPWPAELAGTLEEETVVCRCERITAGEIRDSVRCTDAGEINRAKAFCRVGMGRCQGRYCADAAAAIITAVRDDKPEAAGRLRSQAPIKPIPVGACGD